MGKLIDTITHSREIGTDSNGKKKYISTRVGSVFQTDKGARQIVIDYKPVKAGGTYWLNEYKPKDAVESTEETSEDETPF